MVLDYVNTQHGCSLGVNDWPSGVMREVNEYQHSSVQGSFWLNRYLIGTGCVLLNRIG